MARLVGEVDLTGAALRQVFTTQNLDDGGGGFIIGNESGFTVVVKMNGTSDQKTLYASTVDFFRINTGFLGTIDFQVVAVLANVAQWPSSQILLDVVGLNEQVNYAAYPMPLPRQVSIGNNLNVGISTSAIDNEGNPPGTSIIKSIVSGDGVNLAVSLTNDGILIIGDAAHHGSVSFDNATIVSDGSGNFDVGGNLGVDGVTTLDSTLNVAGVEAINATASNLVQLLIIPNADNAQAIRLTRHAATQSANMLAVNSELGALLASIAPSGSITVTAAASIAVTAGGSLDSTGVHAGSGNAVFFSVGSITGFSRFTGTGSVSVATGLTNPFSIMADPCNVSGSSQTWGGTRASTCVVTTGAGLAWEATAYN